MVFDRKDSVVLEPGVSSPTRADEVVVVRPTTVDGDDDIFPEGTSEFVRYLNRAQELGPVRLDSSEDRYVELAQYDVVLTLGVLFVKWIALPTFTGILAAYIAENLRDPESATVRFQLQTDRCVVKYDGPGDKVEAVLAGAIGLVEKKQSVGARVEDLEDVTHLLEEC